MFFLIALVVFFGGCLNANTPPSLEDAEAKLIKNKIDVYTITEYLRNISYDKIIISRSDGSMFADFSTRHIEENMVVEAIARLFENEQYYSIYKHGNTIEFSEWKGLQDTGSGIAFSLNGVDVPQVAYTTIMTPLSQSGWYYYVEDYNSWRIDQTAE